METRSLEVFGITEDIEVRAAGDGKPDRLVGYAVVWNSLSRDLGGFKEKVSSGAFKDSIGCGIDIRALVGHDPAKLLGRTTNGTLRVAEDDRGLRVEVDMPDTSYARDLMEMVKRRDVRGMSFGFQVRGADGHRFSKEGGQTIREIRAADLKEVSVVANPAYDATSVQLRVDPAVVQQAKSAGETPELARRRMQFRKILAS